MTEICWIHRKYIGTDARSYNMPENKIIGVSITGVIASPNTGSAEKDEARYPVEALPLMIKKKMKQYRMNPPKDAVNPDIQYGTITNSKNKAKKGISAIVLPIK